MVLTALAILESGKICCSFDSDSRVRLLFHVSYVDNLASFVDHSQSVIAVSFMDNDLSAWLLIGRSLRFW